MCRYGDIYMAKLELEGNMQSGRRPVLIVSSNFANRYSKVVLVVPLTSKLKKRELPTHVIIEGCGLIESSMVLAEQITSLCKFCLLRKVGSIQNTIYEEEVRKAIGIQLNLFNEV